MLIIADACIHERRGMGEKLVYALLLIQVFNHGRVFACKRLESLFTAGIGNRSAVEDESAAISGFVFRQAIP